MAADPCEVSATRIVLISLADGRTERLPVGYYLESYDPEGDNGNGIARWTPEPAEAMTIAAGEAATACYRHLLLHSRC